MNLSRHQFLRLIAGAAAVPAGSRLAWGESASQLPFAQSSVLTGIYGTENKFQAVVAGELGSLDTTDKMVDFLKQKVIELGKDAGGKALKWASAELLNVFGLGGGSSELGEIKATLLKILETQQLILGKLEALLLEVQFQHLVTRGYESVERVTNAFQALQALSEISDVDERKREADRIKKGTLDLNQGTKFNLNTISDVMLGKDHLGQSQPMIDLFVERWLPVYRQKQCRDDVPLSTYHEQLDAWLHGLFMIQYMGIVELANARIANRDFESLKKEMTDTILRMEAQRALLAEAIPECLSGDNLIDMNRL